MKHSFRPSNRKHQSQPANKELFRFRGLAPEAVFDRLPQLRGHRRIHVSFRPNLTAHRGKLLSKSPKGHAVYAGSFLRKRKIVLDEQMLRTPRVLERIFVHEVFHFVWSKLRNDLRCSYEDMVLEEFENNTLGELGWSAESMKLQLTKTAGRPRLAMRGGWRRVASRLQNDVWQVSSTDRERQRRDDGGAVGADEAVDRPDGGDGEQEGCHRCDDYPRARRPSPWSARPCTRQRGEYDG